MTPPRPSLAASLTLTRRSMRVRQWLPYVALPAAGIDPTSPMLAEQPERLAFEILRGIAVAALALAYAYGLNSIADRRTDVDPEKNPLIGVATIPRMTIAILVALAIAAVAVAATHSPVSAAAAAISIAAATLYHASPRLKSYPFTGTVLNLLVCLPLMAVALPAGLRPADFEALVIAFAALYVQNRLLHERVDLIEDHGAGIRSTAALLGEEGTQLAIVVVALGGAVAGFFYAPTVIQSLAIGLVFVVSCLVAVIVTEDLRRRELHRAIAFAGGTLIYAAGWIPF